MILLHLLLLIPHHRLLHLLMAPVEMHITNCCTLALLQLNLQVIYVDLLDVGDLFPQTVLLMFLFVFVRFDLFLQEDVEIA